MSIKKRKSETAGGEIPFNDGLAPGGNKQNEPDTVLLGHGRTAVRLGMMMRMRRNASLSGQHRQVQRLDKEIMLLRASLGLTPDPPTEITRTHRNGKDPTNGEDLMISSKQKEKANDEFDWNPKPDPKRGYETIKSDGFQAAKIGQGVHSNPYQEDTVQRDWWKDGHDSYHQMPRREAANDIGWMKGVTTRNLATLTETLNKRGYEYSVKKDGHLTVHTFKGYYGPQPDKLDITLMGREWAAAAVRNGNRLPVFDFSKSEQVVEKGIPLQITAATWDGKLDSQVKQSYAVSWAELLKAMK